MQQAKPIKHIVIVGGGSAGWLTAGLIAAEYDLRSDDGLQLTLIESPDVSTVGVGEGTWPTMRTTLQRIGISERDFLVECSASFKQGTCFDGWRTGEPGDRYYHPFSPPAVATKFNLAAYWPGATQTGDSFANAVTPQGKICDLDLAPRPLEAPDYSAVLNYGYHLDAGKFGGLLQRHCTEKLGVRHVLDHVVSVDGEPGEDVRSVTTKSHGPIEGDLFIDCTGFSSLLMERHFNIPFVGCRGVPFNDSALAAQVPYRSNTDPVASHTISTAQESGWTWDIGLSSRRGVGYTWSSDHGNDSDAERVLAAYIAKTSGVTLDDLEPRKIAFTPGYREKFWHRNCVAVGMSAGFLEPLEASALVMIELAGRMIAEELPTLRSEMDVVADRFNESFSYRWSRIIDFLKLHYVLSHRDDSPYWLENREQASSTQSLDDLLTIWQSRVPWQNDFPQRNEVFSWASYQYVLYGMDFPVPGSERARRDDRSMEAKSQFEAVSRGAQELVAVLPSTRDILTYIEQGG